MMLPRSLWLLALGLVACTPRVPPHLAVDPPAPATLASPITDVESAVAAFVQRDPLARSPSLPDADRLDALPGCEPLASYVRRIRQLEAGNGQVDRELQQLEDEWAGTAVVALTRGYRLRLVENLLATTPELDEPAQERVAVLLNPVQDSRADDTLPLGALQWLDSQGSLNDAIRRSGDRWVLAGWLDHPEIPLAPVGKALEDPLYDGLVATPVGALVAARASGSRTVDPTPGLADLTEATRLALVRAAADRDKEQAAWAEERDRAAAALDGREPITALLQRAAERLTPAAGDDSAAGGALLALAALRWLDACADPPCVGADRTAWMRSAGSWSDEVGPLARVWRVIALKEAIDAMEVGHDTVLYPKAMLQLVDALHGTDAGTLELALLRRRSPEPQTWLDLARAVDTEGATNWSEVRVALGRHLEQHAALALEQAPSDPIREALTRIRGRAVP